MAETTPKYDREALKDAIQAGLCEHEHDEKCAYPSCPCPASMWLEYRREAHAVIDALEAGGYTITPPDSTNPSGDQHGK